MNKFKRISALILAMSLVSMVICTAIAGITGSDLFPPLLAITIIIPCVLWGYIMIFKFINLKKDK